MTLTEWAPPWSPWAHPAQHPEPHQQAGQGINSTQHPSASAIINDLITNLVFRLASYDLSGLKERPRVPAVDADTGR